MKKSIEELVKIVEERTDPSADPVEQLNIIARSDMWTRVIMGVRIAHSDLALMTSDTPDGVPEHPHVVSARAEFADAQRKLEKAARFLVWAYAHHLDNLQTCSCTECRAGQAHNN